MNLRITEQKNTEHDNDLHAILTTSLTAENRSNKSAAKHKLRLKQPLMNIPEGDAIFYAAAIAAAISIISLVFTLISNRSTDLKAARRATLSSSFSELGELLYELVALSVKMKKMKSSDNFDSIRSKAEETSKKIDELRRKTRYPLWGIDGGLRAIRWTPIYIAHLKDERDGDRAGKIIKLSTALRESIDRAICHAYFTGQQPTTRQRLIIWWRARCFRKYYESCNSTTTS